MSKRIVHTNPATSDQIRDSWENLGIAFSLNESEIKNADPEQTLLSSLKEFQEDRKLLKLVLAWLAEYGDLVHVERIKALATNLSPVELAWLGGLASHQANGTHASLDRRWISVMEFARKKISLQGPQLRTSQLDELQAQKLGADEGFQSFGIRIPVVEAADPKKLRTRLDTIKGCLWFRMRVLFGTNWRADVAVVMLLGRSKTSYQAGRALGCSAETAYRNWNSLHEAGLPELLKSVA